MTPEELKRIRELADAASPAPWFNGSDPSHFDSPEVTDRKTFAYYVTLDKDAAFIAAARSDIPALLAEVERLRARVATLEESLDATCEACDGACPHRKETP